MSSSQHPTLVLRGSAPQYTLLTCQLLTQLFSIYFRLIYICVFCRICPIFQISNVTGENMDLLKMFLNLLSSRSSFKDHEPAEFQIDDTYSVPVSMLSVSVYIYMFPLSQRSDFFGGKGVGTVVSGTTLRGLIRLNDTLLLGPDPLGAFLSITVKSIHRKRMPVKEVRGGQTASFALKKVCGFQTK